MISPPYATGRRDPGSRPEQWFGQFWKLLVRLALLAFAGYFFWRVRSILTDVLVAAILAFALVGPVNALCRLRVKRLGTRTHRLLATLVVFLGFGALLFQSASLMLSPFRTEAASLSQNLPQYEHKAAALAASARTWYGTLPPDLRAFLQKQDPGSMAPSPTAWLRRVLDATLTGLSKIVDVILIPVLAFYFVLDGHALRNEFLALLPRRRLREAFHLLRESSSIMQSYIIAQFWLCVIAGVVVYIGLSAIGMKYALILGLLAGFTRAIPIIGPIIGGTPIVLLALIVPGGGFLLARQDPGLLQPAAPGREQAADAQVHRPPHPPARRAGHHRAADRRRVLRPARHVPGRPAGRGRARPDRPLRHPSAPPGRPDAPPGVVQAVPDDPSLMSAIFRF